MLRRIILIVLLTNFCLTWSQFPVWQGFEMDWTYNHRLNRLGSFIYQDSVVVTAATRTGKDSGWFNTRYMLIPSGGRQYHEMKIYRRIEARENELINIQIDTVLPYSYHLSIFYLNGFDIIANNDADKLQMLQASVNMVSGDFDSTKLRIQLSMMFNCQSLECDWLNNDVDYDFNLYIGNISFPNEDYLSYLKGEMYNATHTWTRKAQPAMSAFKGDSLVPRFITEFKFALNKAHWYTGIAAYIDENNSAFMRFMQYRPNMKKFAYYKPHGNFSKKSKGSAMFEMNGITLNHPKNVKATKRSFKGSMIWKGNNRSAFSREAVRSEKIK